MDNWSANDIISGIEAHRDKRHDTVYCSKQQESELIGQISTGILTQSADDIRIAGLDVESIPRFESRPIVCQKGDVFPLAKDYKYE